MKADPDDYREQGRDGEAGDGRLVHVLALQHQQREDGQREDRGRGEGAPALSGLGLAVLRRGLEGRGRDQDRRQRPEKVVPRGGGVGPGERLVGVDGVTDGRAGDAGADQSEGAARSPAGQRHRAGGDRQDRQVEGGVAHRCDDLERGPRRVGEDEVHQQAGADRRDAEGADRHIGPHHRGHAPDAVPDVDDEAGEDEEVAGEVEGVVH